MSSVIAGVHGEEYMNRLFECYMRLKHGDRYDLTRDADRLLLP